MSSPAPGTASDVPSMHPVALVGAGPGNPGLLTVRAVECLCRADLVLYDRLVPARLLDCVPPTARKICVEALHGDSASRYPEVHGQLIEAARSGLRAVHLKGGDPFVFGRGGEEIEELRRAGIPFEVVPGVTAALGAAAFAGIPLTHRLYASAVAFVTGHQRPDADIDWAAVARFPGTLVVYMGMARLATIVEQLLRHGMAPDTPTAVVRWGSTACQQTLRTTLAHLAVDVQAQRLGPPAIIIVGSVVRCRGEASWFESLPLFGRHVLLTRPRDQAAGMAAQLEQLGAAVYRMPLLEIREPPDWAPVDQALTHLGEYDWVVFTSANGVRALLERLLKQGLDLRALATTRLAAIGPATAEMLRSYHLQSDLVPLTYTSEGLAAALRGRVMGQRVLLARADRGRELLQEELLRVARVEQISVYSQSDAVADPTLLQMLREGRIDYVTLTSSNIARAFAAAVDEPTRKRIDRGALQLVSISPVTTAAAMEAGLPPAAEAREATGAGVVAALVALARGR